MRNRSSIPILRGISITILSIAIVLVVISLIGYSRQRNNYPAGMTIAGVHVGGVDPQIASQRVLQVYSSPIEIQYGEAVIHVDPTVVGFELNLDSMMAAADLARVHGLSRTSSALKLSYYDLQRRLVAGRRQRRRRLTPTPFVEVAPPAWAPDLGERGTVELVQASGARLTLRLPTPSASDLLALVHLFLRHRA